MQIIHLGDKEMFYLPKLFFIMTLIARDSVIKVIYSAKQGAVPLYFCSNLLKLSSKRRSFHYITHYFFINSLD